ncbi:unnamed protein product [Heterotrigona itama]|uniref:Uncharacterized protein n=1 Tax=Heterotrigona itama TaxID=395501 RepID=A0A6V7H0E3_9HYME|nr:unnamed protein product [Heterotrigona itama]
MSVQNTPEILIPLTYSPIIMYIFRGQSAVRQCRHIVGIIVRYFATGKKEMHQTVVSDCEILCYWKKEMYQTVVSDCKDNCEIFCYWKKEMHQTVVISDCGDNCEILCYWKKEMYQTVISDCEDTLLLVQREPLHRVVFACIGLQILHQKRLLCQLLKINKTKTCDESPSEEEDN